MSTFDRVRDLPLLVEAYRLEAHEHVVSPAFTRRTTVVRLAGGGAEGVGEDVGYGSDEQAAFQAAGAVLELAGEYSLESFSARLEELELFSSAPSQAAYRDYRRWAFESAALDLALRQAGRSAAEVLEREPRPLHFVLSLGASATPTLEPIQERLRLYPDLRFKLDAGAAWDEAFVAELRQLGVVDTVDLKGAYVGTTVDLAPEPALYRAVVEGLPEAWIEDPALTEATRPILSDHMQRVTWDAPIHSVADIQALEVEPRTINLKPSRFGTLRRLFDAYDHCASRGIAAYGGGQFELSVGRGQIQYLASLFHPDGSNDVAPSAFNTETVPSGLPTSPLAAAHHAIGFRWG